jgi:hypothetical protein
MAVHTLILALKRWKQKVQSYPGLHSDFQANWNKEMQSSYNLNQLIN